MGLKGVIKKAILSEKAYKQMEKGIYTFLVDKRSTKSQIAKQISSQFAVDAIKVNITNVAPKSKRIAKSRKQVKVGGGKKAVVYLKAGQTIAMLSPKSEAKSKKTKDKDKDKNKEKEVQKVSVEGKEG